MLAAISKAAAGEFVNARRAIRRHSAGDTPLFPWFLHFVHMDELTTLSGV